MKNIIALAATVAALAFVGTVTTATHANACNKGISCNQPTGVSGGNKAPIWQVAYCVVGNPGQYRKVNCKSPDAVHPSPLGDRVVCFIGTDHKVHWDAQWAVEVGNRFINRNLGGRWQPDWQ